MRAGEYWGLAESLPETDIRRGSLSRLLQLRNFKNPVKEHGLNSEMGGAIGPVCWGRGRGGEVRAGRLGWAGYSTKSSGSLHAERNLALSAHSSSSDLSARAKPAGLAPKRENFLEALGWCGVIPAAPFREGRVHALKKGDSSQKPTWLDPWRAFTPEGCSSPRAP